MQIYDVKKALVKKLLSAPIVIFLLLLQKHNDLGDSFFLKNFQKARINVFISNFAF